MGKNLAGLVVAMTLVGFSLPANAVIVDVFAQANSTSGGGTGLDTGVNVTAGDSLWIMVDPDDCWSAGSGNRTTNADGLVATGIPTCQTSPWTSGVWTQGGLTAPFASLVGSLDSGASFFLVGTNFNETATQSGLLTLYFFDSNSGDNSGSVRATIMNHGGATVPEPATLLLLGLGLAGLGFARKRLH